MAVFFVVLTTTTLRGTPTSFQFEAPYETVQDLSDAAQTSYLISGARLSWTDDGRGGRLVRSREPLAIGVPAISTITPCRFRYWEPE